MARSFCRRWSAPQALRFGVVVVFALVATALVATSAGGAPLSKSAPAAVELQQVLGKGDRLDVVVSDTGAAATETRGKTRAGVIVRYDDGSVFSLDYGRKAYAVQTIANTATALQRERKLVGKVKIEIPTKNGDHSPVLRWPTLTPLGLEAKIAGLPAHAFALHQDGVKTAVRLWLADDLPAPPDAIQQQVAAAVPLAATARQALLRTEMQFKGRWLTGLDTVDSAEVQVDETTFAPPKGWRRVKAPPKRRLASIPARPLRFVGPVSANPDVFALYWNGGPFSLAFRTATNGLLTSMVGGGPTASSYWTPLAQYGVGRGRFIGSSPIAFPLPAAVGDWDFFTVEGMITFAYVVTPAPKIWWRAFSRDPIIAIMIPSAAVVASSWAGYHMVNLSVGAFLPWPVSLAAHPEMPWLITKSSPTTGPPNIPTTTNLSHELVETATDPLPLSANTDYTKSPPWTGGEIADICSVGTPLPPSTTIVKFGFTLSRYWSNAAGTCVG